MEIPDIKTFLIDQRATRVLADVNLLPPDALLTTEDVAHLWGCSKQWLEIRRSKGGGPP